MPKIVHMQLDRKKYENGTPLHYAGGASRKKNRFQTTNDPAKVTCKMCLRMLSKRS